jgi:hypothetical protein
LHPHLERIIKAINALEIKFDKKMEIILMNTDEFTTQLEAQAVILEATKAQVDKVYNEVSAAAQTQSAAIAALQAEIAAAGTGLSEAAVAALAHIAEANQALAASVQSIDDLNLDPQAPAPEQAV